MRKKKKAAENKWRMKETQHSDHCWWWLASLFMAFTLGVIATACDSDIPPLPAEEAEGLPATIRLNVTTDVATQVQARVDENVIKNLHILVYNSEGELIGRNYNTATPFTVDTRSGNSNTIYAIANTGNSTLFNGTVVDTEAKLKAMKTPALTKWDELTTASHLVMVGSKTEVTIAAGSSTLSGEMTVARTVAKVTLNITAKSGSGIMIKDYRMFSLPKQSYYVPDATADAATTWISDSISTTVNVASVNKTFFMYENRKGTVDNITAQKDKGASKAPANASYVVIKGKANGYDAIWRVYLGENNTSDFNIKRNSRYTYNITLNRPGVDGIDTRIVDGISNCYMLLPGSAVTIPVIRANDSPIEIKGSIYNKTTKTYDQLQEDTPWTASLVWESSKGLVTLSETTGIGSLGRFKVTAKNTSTQGNAVVAIKNRKNEILWSWHIWVTTYNGNTRFTNNNGNRDFTFMDRALGATSATAGQLTSCGLMYQWGRKDPFPGIGQQGGSWSVGNDIDPIRVYNASGNLYEITKTHVSNVTPDNLTNATRNPDMYYYNTAYPNDWFVYNNSSTQNNNLWSGGAIVLDSASPKSVFDPCPAGWRVPPWLNSVSPFANMGSGWSWSNYGQNWSGTGGHFPASGFRLSSNGLISNASTVGRYWSASSYSVHGYSFLFSSMEVFLANNDHRTGGFPIRCCLDNL